MNGATPDCTLRPHIRWSLVGKRCPLLCRPQLTRYGAPGSPTSAVFNNPFHSSMRPAPSVQWGTWWDLQISWVSAHFFFSKMLQCFEVQSTFLWGVALLLGPCGIWDQILLLGLEEMVEIGWDTRQISIPGQGDYISKVHYRYWKQGKTRTWGRRGYICCHRKVGGFSSG